MGFIRFSRCLKVGMNPELVDASLKLKSLKEKKLRAAEPVMIDNSEPLEPDDLVSEVFRVTLLLFTTKLSF